VPRPPIDITNRRYGSWTAISKGDRLDDSHWKWLCRCDCGTERQVDRSALSKGLSKSCGCQWQPRITHGNARRDKHTRLYRIWKNMRQRCRNTSNPDWKNYGGRGISICAEWTDFGAFHSWALANGYADHLTIDRIDNDGPYTSDNCRWIPLGDQWESRRPKTH